MFQCAVSFIFLWFTEIQICDLFVISAAEKKDKKEEEGMDTK